MSMIIDVEVNENVRRVELFDGDNRLTFVSDSVITKVFDNKGAEVLWTECHFVLLGKFPGINEVIEKYYAGINLGFDERIISSMKHCYYPLLKAYMDLMNGNKEPVTDIWVRFPFGGISGKINTSDKEGNEISYSAQRKFKNNEFVTNIVKLFVHGKEISSKNKVDRRETYHIHTSEATPIRTIEEMEKFLSDHVKGYK